MPAIPRRLVLAGLLAGLLAGPWAGPPARAQDGDAGRGALLWQRCASCHAIGPEARNSAGPHLNALFGRPAAAVADFRYSSDMRRAGTGGLVWTREKLDVFLENPRALIAGTHIGFRGIADVQARHDLLAYLRGFSASARDIPESAPTADPADPDVAPEVLAINGDPDYGRYLSSECTTCHQADGADSGIPAITGWPIEDFVTAMHAYKSAARPHPIMRMMAGRLSNEEIAALAVYFRGLR